jgi:hypothetical protein
MINVFLMQISFHSLLIYWHSEENEIKEMFYSRKESAVRDKSRCNTEGERRQLRNAYFPLNNHFEIDSFRSTANNQYA